VLAIRQIRGELDVRTRRHAVYVRSDRDGDAEAITALAGTIARVGNLESVTMVATEADLSTLRHLPSSMAAPCSRRSRRLVDDVSAEIAPSRKAPRQGGTGA